LVRKFLRLVKEKLKDLSGRGSDVKDKRIKTGLETGISAESSFKQAKKENNSKPLNKRSSTDTQHKSRNTKAVADPGKKNVDSSKGTKQSSMDSSNKSREAAKLKEEAWQND